jgi:hypothetical protein
MTKIKTNRIGHIGHKVAVSWLAPKDPFPPNPVSGPNPRNRGPSPPLSSKALPYATPVTGYYALYSGWQIGGDWDHLKLFLGWALWTPSHSHVSP